MLNKTVYIKKQPYLRAAVDGQLASCDWERPLRTHIDSWLHSRGTNRENQKNRLGT